MSGTFTLPQRKEFILFITVWSRIAFTFAFPSALCYLMQMPDASLPPPSSMRPVPSDPLAEGGAAPAAGGEKGGKHSSCNGVQRVASREIWALTWPQTLMMLLQFLVGFTDVTVAGRIGPAVQGALGMVTQCQFFLLVFGIALVNGGTAAMSQALGAGLSRRAERYVGLICKLSLFMCALTMAAALSFQEGILRALRVPDEIFPQALDMWSLYMWIMPASYLSITTAAVFRSRKDVWTPLVSGMVVCLVNMVGDLGFGLGWFGLPAFGARGIVWSSILAVSAGGLYNLAVLLRRRLLTARSFAPLHWERRALPYIIKTALPAGGNQVLWQIGYLVLFGIINTLPTDRMQALSGMVAGMRIEAVLFLPAFAFNMTGSVLIGHCLGAGNRAEAKRVALRIIYGGALCMSLAAGLVYLFLDPITSLVAPDPAVREIAVLYMIYNLLATPCTVTSMISAGIFAGAGASVYNLACFSASFWLVRLPAAWFLGHYLWGTASGVFFAMLLSQVVQASLSLYIIQRCDWYRFASTAKRFK